MSKSGFSTLNRWLGRKNKEKSMVNGKLSKSSTNLSISSININETSQLEYNRITPLPAATTNAPFEQTFRITVLLPKDQLYVTRLGARVPLSKLLELVCDNKLLDEQKYEFRNPVDPSQVYSCDLTIGAVGLSEVRLCHKTESYDNFNSDEIIKLQRTSLIRESLSSSEFSSRNSKHTTKTTSPYSSTNSLNSIDSAAVSCGGRGPVKCSTKLTAPPRRKRTAPRPPKQIAIPEKYPLIMENGHDKGKGKVEEGLNIRQEISLTTKDLSISTPNLSSSTLLHSDINGNDCNGHLEDFNDESSGNGSLNSHGYNEDTVLYAQVQKKNALNSQSHGDLENCMKHEDNKFPEPSPRKQVVVFKKKTSAPPAPPPRNSLYQEDNVSLASTNVSVSSSTPTTPNSKPEVSKELFNNNNNLPTPLPRIVTTSTTLLNATDVEEDIKLITCSDLEDTKHKVNVSKVLLNRTPTPEPCSLSCEPSEQDNSYETQLAQFEQQQTPEEDCISKLADSGIGEPVPSPLPDSHPSKVSQLNVKLNHFESSSDDDDMVKVYNFKLGKTLVKPVSETKTLEELTIMNSTREETDSELSTPLILGPPETTSNTLSETSSWNFAIPISPPPNFADHEFAVEPQPDTPITPKIMERPVLNFEDLKQEHENQPAVPVGKLVAKTPLANIVQELSSIILEKGVDSLVKRSEEPPEIEAAKPNTLSNFTINAIDSQKPANPKEVLKENVNVKTISPSSSLSSNPEEEKLYRKRSSVTSLKQRRSITRSDSFHTTAASLESLNSNKRTASQLSLDQQMTGNLNRRKSSSELSIGESPSLQSLEIIKTILNSRKNSLANSSAEEDKEIEIKATKPAEDLKFASLELKSSKGPATTENPMQTQHQNENVKEPPAKELPKMYRYSGPPSINFSTWSERPKSQVAIKNEGDYIFGGGGGGGGGGKNTQTPKLNILNEAPHKPGPTQRMGIPEKEYKVPILVKPLKDVVIEKQENSLPLNSNTVYNAQRPTVESVLKPQTQFRANTSARPSVEQVLAPQIQIITNTSTLPRAAKHRYSTPASRTTQPLHAQLLGCTSAKQPYEIEIKTSHSVYRPPGPQILRSSSINWQETEKSATASMQPAPFGQNTLRRTGYKEKMLAQEEREQQRVSFAQQAMGCNNDAVTQTNQQKSPQTITSAKLHLKLKNIYNNNSNSHPTTAVPSYSSAPCSVTYTLESPQLKLNSTIIPQTAPVTNKSNSSFPLPPPLQHAMNGIQLQPITTTRVRTSPTSSTDPRDELLSAIRSFSREGLKKA